MPHIMPLLVISEYNKDYYDPNVVYTSFGRNKTSSPQTAHSQGRVGGGRDRGGTRGEMGKTKKGVHDERESKITKMYYKSGELNVCCIGIVIGECLYTNRPLWVVTACLLSVCLSVCLRAPDNCPSESDSED